MCRRIVISTGRRQERGKGQGNEIYGRAPKLRRGTACSCNKCGLRRITAMRDALVDKMVLAKNGERKLVLREGPLIAEILEVNWNKDRASRTLTCWNAFQLS